MSHQQLRTLLLDDEDYYRRAMAAALRNTFDFTVDEAADPVSAALQVSESGGAYDVILIDQHLADGMDGVEVMGDIRREYPEIVCIILTGFEPEDRERALAAGAFRYVQKMHANANELALLIQAAAQQARMRALSRDLMSQLEQQDILRRALGGATTMVETDDAAIALYDDETKRWEWFGLDAATGEPTRCPPFVDERQADKIRRDGRPITAAGLENEPGYETAAQRGFGSLAAMPIPTTPAPGCTVGLGALFALGRGREPLDVDRLSRLNELATMTGLALDNARAFRKSSDLAGNMAALANTAVRLAQTTDPEALFRSTWEFVNKELGVDTFFIALYDAETDLVNYPAMWDEGQPAEAPPFTLSGNNRITAHVIQTGIEQYWPTLADRERYCQAVNVVPLPWGRVRESCLYFPLQIGERVIGVMSMQALKPHAFSYEARIACRSLSNQLAVALENARLMGEVRRKVDDLATLQTLSVDIASSLDMKTVGRQTCAAAVRFFGADHSGLVLFGDDDETGRVAAEFPPAGALGLDIPLSNVDDELTLIRERRPLAITNVADRHTLGPVRDILLALGIQATLIVPVVAGDRLFGSFSIDYHQPHRFSPQDEENARMFAAQVAVALDHAHHFDLATRSRSQVRLLHKISNLIQTSDELEDIFHMVLTGVTAGFGLRFNAAALLLPDGNDLVGQIGIGHFNKKDAEADWLRDDTLPRNEFEPYYDRLRQGEFRTNRTPLDHAMRALRFPVATADDDLLSEVLAHPQIRTIGRDESHRLPRPFVDAFRPGFPLIVVPLMARGRVIGLLAADNRFTSQTITRELHASLSGFADTLAVAIDNGRLQQETRRRLEETQAARREAEAQAETNARLSKQRELVLSKATDVAAAVAQEDLATTLNAIAEGTRAVLDADVVTVYGYDTHSHQFTDLGHSVNVLRVPGSIRPPTDLSHSSVIYDIINAEGQRTRRLHDDAHPDLDLIRGEFVRNEGIQASVGLQLRSQGERLGVIFVNFRSRHRFGKDELNSIQHFADQAAVAIYAQRQYHQATRHARVSAGLNSASRLISSAESLDATLEQIAHQALEVTEATDSQAACYVLLRRGDVLRFAATSPPDILERLRRKNETISLGGDKVGIIGRAAVSGVSINSPNAPEHPDYIEFEPGTRSELAVPIKDRSGQVIGVINLEHPDEHYFPEEDTVTVESLAALAAVAIQNKQYLVQKDIVAKISARVNTSRTLDEFLNTLFEQLVDVFKQREVVIYPTLALYEPQSEQLRMTKTKYFPSGVRGDFIRLDEHGIIPHVARTGKSHYAADVRSDEHYYRLLNDTCSEFATPVRYDGRLLAVLDVESPVPNALSRDDIDLLETLAHQIATTIHNVNQNEKLQSIQKASIAKTTMLYMGMVNSQWSHRIYNQAQIIGEQTDMLRADLQRPAEEQGNIPNRLDVITEMARAIMRKPITEPLHESKGVELRQANQLLRDTIDRLAGRRWDRRPMQRDITPRLSCRAGEEDGIEVNRAWFEAMVENVLENAVNYAAEGASPQIDIVSQRVANRVEIRFIDNGPGIDGETRRSLQHGPLTKDHVGTGLGMGLFIVRMIMETYRGELDIEDNIPHGTIITMRFPLKLLPPAEQA